jgi:hypothetical protein
MHRHLTLVLPDLALCEAQMSTLSLPYLQQLLRRGQPKAESTASVSDYYFSQFGLESMAEWPIAALTAFGEGLSGTHPYWLRADPISLRADHSTVYLCEMPALSEAENMALLTLLNDFLAQDNLRLIAKRIGTWYLNVATNPELRSPDPTAARGYSIVNYLTLGPYAPGWRRLFTELQLLLSDCAINQARRLEGNATVDGLWFWGGGCLPRLAPPTLQAVGGDDPLLNGLALLAHVPRFFPSGCSDWLMAMDKPGNYLLTLDAVPADEWFLFLLQALKAKKLSMLDLYFGNNKVYHIGKSSSWWPRRKITETGFTVLS